MENLEREKGSVVFLMQSEEEIVTKCCCCTPNVNNSTVLFGLFLSATDQTFFFSL